VAHALLRAAFISSEAAQESGSIENVYLDAKTFLPVKSAGTRKQQDHEIAYESFPGTSNLLNGVMMPFSLNQKMNGRSMLELTVVKVDVNTPMDDSISQIPEPPSPKK